MYPDRPPGGDVQPVDVGGLCAPADHMSDLYTPADTLGRPRALPVQLIDTASSAVCVSVPPTRYPWLAGLHPSHPNRMSMVESKPASKGPAIVVPMGKEMDVVYASVPATVVVATPPRRDAARAFVEDELPGGNILPPLSSRARASERARFGSERA